MVDKENDKHDGYDATQQHYEAESVLIVHQVLYDELPIGCHYLTSHVVPELSAPESLLVDNASENLNAHDEAVNCNNRV